MAADGKRAPLTAISLQAVDQGSHAHIYRKDVVTKKIRKKCHFFTKSHRNQFWWLDNNQQDYQDNKTWKFLENENFESW